jgi:hypothetical protein
MGNGHFVLRQEFNEIIPVYPIMIFRKPERGQAFFFNPAQYRYCTHPATLSNKTGGNIFRTPILFPYLQASLLMSVLRDIINLGYLGYLRYLMIFTHLLYVIRITAVS